MILRSKIQKNGIFEDLRTPQGWKTAKNGFFRKLQSVFNAESASSAMWTSASSY